jgi:hypothetical protein
MTKKLLKRKTSKKLINKNKKTTKKYKNKNYTKRNRYGGDPDNTQQNLDKIRLYRQALQNNIIQIKNIVRKSDRNPSEASKKINSAVVSIIDTFKRNENMINGVLIPVTEDGIPVDKTTYKMSKTPIYDFVSPVTVILNNLSKIISEKYIVEILDAYRKLGGNFNNLSRRLRISPLKDQIDRGNVENVKLLLREFPIMEEGLDEETKTKLAELIPNEQQIIAKNMDVNSEENINAPDALDIGNIENHVKLSLPYQLPENNDVGYDRTIIPKFWKPIFSDNGKELLDIREKFMGIYEKDKYDPNNPHQVEICSLLERIIPGYFTSYAPDGKKSIENTINYNILNCFITLLFGFILYKLYDTKQDFIFIFKGGRAIQLGLNDIKDISQYFSEDADLLIIPNPSQNASYDLEKMENLSSQIAYLIKWMIPEELNIIVSLPSNPKNTNKDIVKLVYNDGRFFKALSDIGFGEVPEDVKKYFTNLIYSPIYVDVFEEITLFIIPDLEDMLSEKLYYYIKYYYLKKKLESGEPLEKKYENITTGECDFYMYKFQKAIYKLIEAIINKDYSSTENLNKREAQVYIMRSILSGFEDYTIEQKEEIIAKINP